MTHGKSKALIVGAAAVVFVVVFGLWGAQRLAAEAPPGFKRVELQKHDIAVAGREALMTRGEFNPGAAVPKHTHPGDEVGYVLDGQIVFEMEGKPPATLKAGDVFFVPAGTVHTAKNSGTTLAKVLSTYIVEKGKPLATPVK